MYKIYINGILTEPESITVSAHPFNRQWPGKQRDASQTETAYMLRVFGEGALRIEIETDFPVASATVRPLSKRIRAERLGNKVSLLIPQNGKYAIEINGKAHAIHLFYQKPIDDAGSTASTYYFGAGRHDVGLIRLSSNSTVYIARDAVVHGSFLAVDAQDIKIYGEGVLCGDWEKRTERHGDLGFDNENEFHPQDIHTCGGIRAYRCQNISVNGITVTDTASYAISFFGSRNIDIDNVNVVGLWKYNCDGIDFFNSSDITVKNCFIRSFDDCMCMKGLTAFSYRNTENAHISDCVFWCDWGKNIDIGLATAACEIKNILWRDCDLIHNSGTCIAISNGQWADVHDVAYKNITVEYASDTETPILQSSDDQVYEPNGRIHIPTLIAITDGRRNWQGNVSYEDERTKIRNILVDGINVITDEAVQETPKIKITKVTQKSVFDNIRLTNMFINGARLDVPED